MGMFDWLPWRAASPIEPDGFGQTLFDDLRFWRHFRRCCRREVAWRAPSDAEKAAIEAHPILGRFGDHSLAVADIADERWIVRERDWFGWPDPPEYVFFALAGDTIRAAVDFDRWPPRWTLPDQPMVIPTTFHSVSS